MAVFMGNFNRENKAVKTIEPWYYYNENTFYKSDFTLVRANVLSDSNKYEVPIIFYNVPIIVRPNTKYTGISYTVDGKNISNIPSGYVYKLYCYFGFCDFSYSRYSNPVRAVEFINNLKDSFKADNDGLNWEIKYNSLYSPDTTTGIFKNASTARWGRITSGRNIVISDFDKRYLAGLLPSDSEAGITTEVIQLFKDFKALRVGDDYSPFACNMYQFNNTDFLNIGTYNSRLLPCFIGYAENLDYLNNTYDGIIYGTYSSCLGINKYNNNDVRAVLCCKPGSILLGTQDFWYTGHTNIYSVSLTYFGVEKVS